MAGLDSDNGKIFQAPAFGSRFGMGVHRFEDILRCSSFGDEDPQIAGLQYDHFWQLLTPGVNKSLTHPI